MAQEQRQRRNISLDPDVNEWLRQDVENASELIEILLMAYRAYGGNELEAVRYTLQYRLHNLSEELERA